ncbi:MAG TPA: alpha/beta fold hydrolase [Allosphingosinicella sp.]|nr:alpha/beta fold hydrolase [Allosphingosinicella sp.]
MSGNPAKRAMFVLAVPALLAGCTAVIDRASFFPQLEPPPQAVLQPPPGYRMMEAMLDLPGLGRVHAVRLDNPASETVIIYHGGNGSFVAAQSRGAAALAATTGADLILYDYPGRGGTDVPGTIEAAIATGPALLAAFRREGWIGRGPLFAYGFSFGGSQAAAMARDGAGFDGLILEGTASDIAAVGRNFVPWIARPFVRIRLDPALARFDYFGYAVSARAPILLISSRDDRVVRPRNMRAFAAQLRAQGRTVDLVEIPGGHGSAIGEAQGRAAIGAFIARLSRR